jgi:DNA end-binding protein Ku
MILRFRTRIHSRNPHMRSHDFQSVVWSLRMAPRPYWKGYLKLSLVSCAIALYPATSSTERVSFNQINKNTGNRVRYKKVDSETDDPVELADIVKGYQVEKGVYVTVDDEELSALQIESNHTIEIDKFVPMSGIDERYFDSPYYVCPNDEVGQEAFAVIRDAMKAKKMVGVGRVVLAKRERPIILRPLGKGLEAISLRYPYEVRGEDSYFEDIPDVKVPPDMIKLAGEIIDSKAGEFESSEFVDHYELAVVDMLKKKQAGQPVGKGCSEPRPAKVVNLMDALRRSAQSERRPLSKRAAAAAKQPAKQSSARVRKAG